MIEKHEGRINNPFRVEGIVERVRHKGGKVREFTDTGTGEMVYYQELAKSDALLNDPVSYTKLFQNAKEIVQQLSPPALRVYLYIAYNVKPHCDTIFLNTPDVCAWGQFGKSVYYKAVTELLEQNIIAKRLGSHLEFWINPNHIFNGNRVKLFLRNKQSVHKDDRMKTITREKRDADKEV